MFKIHSNVLAAIIAAIAAIIASMVTTYGTIVVTKPQAEEVQANISNFTRNFSGLPVGCIVPSMLGPADFAKSVGDDNSSASPKFVLADGRAVPNSAYANITANPAAKVPDLRAMFLRGMNEAREGEYADPNPSRKAGVPSMYATARPTTPFETDEKGEHQHPIVWVNQPGPYGGKLSAMASIGGRNGPGDEQNYACVASGKHTHTVTKGGDVETCPNNAAVYYYIKIN